jgi:hypothetical protein
MLLSQTHHQLLSSAIYHLAPITFDVQASMGIRRYGRIPARMGQVAIWRFVRPRGHCRGRHLHLWGDKNRSAVRAIANEPTAI